MTTRLSDVEVRQLRARLAADVCVCGHPRAEHVTRGGSTAGCQLRGCLRCSNYSRRTS